MARTGRRPGPTRSRERILEVARRQFAAGGYGATSIRGIATEAGVDAALVSHFFGSKDRLFRAAVTWPFDPSDLVPELLGPGLQGLGERLARTFLTVWDDAGTSPRLMALLRSTMTSESAARLLREFVLTQLLQPLGEVVEGPDRELREELAAGHLLGIAILRHVVRMEPVASSSIEELVRWVGPNLDRYLQPGE